MVILGGAFFALGNVNPAAEANVSAGISYTLFLIRDMPSIAGISSLS